MKLSKKEYSKVSTILVGIIYFILVFWYINSYHFMRLDIDTKNLIVSRIGTMSYILSILLWYLNTKQILCPYIIFFTSFFMFQFGQSFLYSLGIELKYNHVFGRFSKESILYAQTYTTYCIILFNLGGIFSINNKNKNNKDYNFQNRKYYMNFVGKILLSISLPVVLYFTVATLINSLIYGYGEAVYEMNIGRNAILNTIESFFLPSICLLLVCNIDNKIYMKKIMILAYTYALINLIIGTRSVAIGIVLGLIWFQNKMINKLNFRRLAILVILIFNLVTIASTAAEFRNLKNKSISDFSQIFVGKLIDNPIKDIIEEMGGSMNPLIQVQNIIPAAMDYQYGKSYVYSLTSVVPNIGGILGEIHPAAKYSALDAWLVDYAELGYGHGFSLVAEAYYNFGIYGMFMIFIIGSICGKLLNYSHTLNSKKIYPLFITITTLVITFTVPRRQSLELVVQVFRYIILPILAIETLYRMSDKKHGNIEENIV